jgi:hypothetical protein
MKCHELTQEANGVTPHFFFVAASQTSSWHQSLTQKALQQKRAT